MDELSHCWASIYRFTTTHATTINIHEGLLGLIPFALSIYPPINRYRRPVAGVDVPAFHRRHGVPAEARPATATHRLLSYLFGSKIFYS